MVALKAVQYAKTTWHEIHFIQIPFASAIKHTAAGADFMSNQYHHVSDHSKNNVVHAVIVVICPPYGYANTKYIPSSITFLHHNLLKVCNAPVLLSVQRGVLTAI